MRRIGSLQLVFLKISQAGAHEHIMSYVGVDARAEFFSHGQASIIHHVAPEERPGPANIRLCGMDGATGAVKKEDAVLVSAGADCKFPVPSASIERNKAFRLYVQVGAHARQIARTQHDAAFSKATFSAHPATEYLGRTAPLRCRQPFLHK
jgi:hypothetical protein